MFESTVPMSKRRPALWAILAVFIVGMLALAMSACGNTTTTETGTEDTTVQEDQSAALDEWLRSFYGINQWSDFESEQAGHAWQSTVENVEVDGSRAILHLGIHPDNPDTDRLGNDAATTVVQQIRANDPPEADGVSIVQAVDSSGTVIGNERL